MQKNQTPKTKHQKPKHPHLNRPHFGQFGRKEWAIIGAPCDNIQHIAQQIIQQLSQYNIAYVDADHQAADEAETMGTTSMSYTDKINFHRFDTQAPINTHQFRQYFNEQDLVIVNGNHFKAQRQIVVIDPKKEKSLEKKLDRLTDVQLLLVEGENTPIPDYLKKRLPNWQELPCFSTTAQEKITHFILEKIKDDIAPLAGLILAGGKSTRMGHDKGSINYHGKTQREYLVDLLNEQGIKSHLSCRADQEKTFPEATPKIIDSFQDMGPFGAILSAFRQQPNHAWLVLACDLPLLNDQTIQQLVKGRNPSKIATAFHNPATNFPDPLLTIWEPKSYPALLQFLAQGYSCPRKVLINSPIELLHLTDPNILKNANTPKEYEEAKKLLSPK